MASDARKRQKQKERKAAKRKSKHQQVMKLKSTSLADRLTAAARCPVLHSWVTEEFWTNGIGWACLSRELPNGSVAFALFLIDRFCIGVKDVLCRVTSRFEYEDRLVGKLRKDFVIKEMAPAGVRKLVESAVAYAESLGIHPHADYAKARCLFGNIDAGQSWEEFEFGDNGKPVFIAGPYDGPEVCNRVVAALREHCGEGNYEVVLPQLELSGLPRGVRLEDIRSLESDEMETDFEDDADDEFDDVR